MKCITAYTIEDPIMKLNSLNPASIKSAALVGGLLLIFAQACIVGQTTHSLYLDPEGAVTWRVIERDQRSDAVDPANAAAEEAELLEAAHAWRHPVAEALAHLGGKQVEVDVIRDRRPFVFSTRARFERLDTLATAWLDHLGAHGEARLIEKAGRLRFELTLDLREALDDEDGDDRILALIEPFEAYRLVLTEGAFTDAAGFTLDSRSTEAMLENLENDDLESLDTDGDGLVTLVLEWTVASSRHGTLQRH